MNAIIQPWQLLLITLAGCMNREQQQIIEYLQSLKWVVPPIDERISGLVDGREVKAGGEPKPGAEELM